MSNDDHDRLIRVAANWYGLYNELFVKAQRLTDEVADWRESCRHAADDRDKAMAENARARALISWIDGMCLDNQPNLDTEIRAAINRYWEALK